MRRKSWIAAVLLLALLAGGAAVWYRQGHTVRGTQAAGDPAARAPASGTRGGAGGNGGAVSVSTVPAQQRDEPVALDATGTVMPLNLVEVHPQLSSLIAQVHVREGQFVRRGDLLFTLDDRSDQVAVAKARAQLARDQAALADAQRHLGRSRELVAQQFLAQSTLDTAQTQVQSQQAAVATSQAAVDAAQLSLGYNRITAPSAGRVGAINVYAGTYVQPTGPALLSITQLDPIAVGFSVPQRYLADALESLRGGDTGVSVELPGGSKPLAGKLQFVDSAVDAASGTVKVKAVFANPQNTLWPGAYATVRMTVRTLDGAIVVPQEAVITSQEGASVYVVGPDGRALMRTVAVVHAAGAEAVVTGLAAGEPVIVDGRRNVRPGVRVVVRNGDAAAPAHAAASAPAP